MKAIFDTKIDQYAQFITSNATHLMREKHNFISEQIRYDGQTMIDRLGFLCLNQTDPNDEVIN